jgi:multiple sugar transport system substrate-binding protein
MSERYPWSARLSRRALVRLATAAGLGAASASLLAACQGGGSSSSGPPATGANAPAPTAASGPAPTAASAPAPTAASAPAPTAASAAGSTAAPAQAGTQAATITWSFWGDPNELPPNDEVIAAFNARYPNIQIKTFHEPWASYFDKIQTMFAGGSAPDVLFLTNIASYASKGVLAPVNDLAKQSGYDITDFTDAELKLFQNQDNLYGFPRDNDTKVLYYNKDAFDQAKIDYPDDTWDWNALRDAANKLTNRQGDRVLRYGAAIEATEWPAFVWQDGVEVYDDVFKPTRSFLDQPDQTAAITFLADLMNTDKVIPSATALTQAGGVTNLFTSGLAAMVISNAPRLLTFAQAPFKWDIAVLPKQKRAANYVGGAGYVMSAQTKAKEAAWTFMQFVNGPEAQKIFSKGGGVVPARVSVQKSDTFLKSGPPGVNMDVFVTATGQGHLNAAGTIGPWQQELSTSVNKDLDVIWAGDAKPAEQLKVVAANATAKLKQLVT